ncbi:hypothetical protein B0H67DRAFT_591225 [Lasiosphaeris hirsuta]|uniref:Uncharacterized protein n=1 Tax=Lasiosphaeris hirsuta TaxID=260670 RepID=A0AA39ZVJ9_9PEZI|nr:hypothetical protein B0H67DRAFT_591225 [Lasiosphaeris hirsuta]
MVLGGGETASDVSYLAVTSPTKQVVMCHRYGFHFAPKRNLNPAILPILGGKPSEELTIPLDNARASLFDTSYVHPILRNSFALWTFYNTYVRFILRMTTGTPGGYGQLVGEPDEEYDHVAKMFFNKSSKAAPYVSAPYRGILDKGVLERIRAALINVPFPDTKGCQIDLAPWPSQISADGTLYFRNTGRPEYHRLKDAIIKPDIAVFCTGYTQSLPFLASSYPLPGEANVRGVWHRSDPTVGFIGFLRPSLGAIPPLAEMQAQLWVCHLLAPQKLPKPLHPRDEPHYRLHHLDRSRIHYGVDHESYVYQLAMDMDSALGFQEAVRKGLTSNWRLPLAWAFGANLNVRFRLRGPWKWEGAQGIMTGEMWSQICRRRWFWTVSDIFFLTILPMSIFGPLSLLCWVYAKLYQIVFGVEPGYGGYEAGDTSMVMDGGNEKKFAVEPNM